jgi:hypothetical protein
MSIFECSQGEVDGSDNVLFTALAGLLSRHNESLVARLTRSGAKATSSRATKQVHIPDIVGKAILVGDLSDTPGPAHRAHLIGSSVTDLTHSTCSPLQVNRAASTRTDLRNVVSRKLRCDRLPDSSARPATFERWTIPLVTSEDRLRQIQAGASGRLNKC